MPLSGAGFARSILLWGEAGRSTPKACDDRRKGGNTPLRVLNSEFLPGHRAVAELARRGLEHDEAFLHDVAAVAHAQGHARVLLDEQDGHAKALQLADHVADVADECRRKPLRRLVHEDDA